MSRKMLINATHPEENRVAIVEDGVLSELDIEVVGREQTRGNIYKACVVRVEQGLQAAFVDYGGERLGFLQMGEIHPDLFKLADPQGERKGKLRINDVLRRGQELIVQVVKGERGTKGAALTTHLSLAGRYMVLIPESDSKGVSRKIEADGERKKLKEAMSSLDLPDNMGYIVRTAGIGQSREELKRDFDYLVRVYQTILSLAKRAKAPALIYKESNLVIRSIRDYFTADIDEVLVDDPKVAQEAKEFFQQVMPECVKLVKLHQERRPIFSRYQIEEQIESIYRNKITLPSGGSIVIDRTEALVAIDVNSGKLAGEQGVEATAFRTNLEAAEEAARQLRLRDLGGLIVIDFIDMRERKHEREVEKRLKDAMKKDKARVTVGKISQFGMLELSRQRIKDALAEGTYLACPHCEGSGRIKSPDAQAVAFLRKVQTGVAKGQIGRVEADLPLDVALYLLNSKRHELSAMEAAGQYEIVVNGRHDLVPGQVELSFVRREKEDELSLQPVTAAAILDEPAAQSGAAPESTVSADDVSVTKKRGRGRRKGKDEANETLPAGAAVVVEEAPANGAAESPAEAATSDEPLAEGAKKKRKRRRKKKKSAGETTEGATAPDEILEAGEDDSEEDDGEDDIAPPVEGAVGDGEKKRKRKRRRKKKSGAAHEAVAAEQALAAPVTADDEEHVLATVDGDDAGKKKRKRKRRKKSAAEGATGGQEPATVAVAAVMEVTSTPADNDTASDVPTKRPPRKRAAKSTTPPEAAPLADAQPAAPAKPTPRKRATKAAESVALPVEAAAENPAAAPKTRSRKKAAASNADTVPSATEAAPRKRAPRKRGGEPTGEPSGE